MWNKIFKRIYLLTYIIRERKDCCEDLKKKERKKSVIERVCLKTLKCEFFKEKSDKYDESHNRVRFQPFLSTDMKVSIWKTRRSTLLSCLHFIQNTLCFENFTCPCHVNKVCALMPINVHRVYTVYIRIQILPHQQSWPSSFSDSPVYQHYIGWLLTCKWCKRRRPCSVISVVSIGFFFFKNHILML